MSERRRHRGVSWGDGGFSFSPHLVFTLSLSVPYCRSTEPPRPAHIIHSCIHTFTESFNHRITHALIYSLIHSCIFPHHLALKHSLSHSTFPWQCTEPTILSQLIHSFMHSFKHTLTLSLIHPFILSCYVLLPLHPSLVCAESPRFPQCSHSFIKLLTHSLCDSFIHSFLYFFISIC